MSHYRLLLRTAQETLAEVHKDVPRPEYGWCKMLRYSLYPMGRVEITVCNDDGCKPYNAWLELKGAHEDAVEAEKRRGEGL